MSATHSTFEAWGRKSRSTRSAAGSTPGTPIVVRHRLRGLVAAIPAAFINLATALAPDPDPALEAQLRVAPRRPIHAPTGHMDLPDLLGQPRVLKRPVGRRPALPGMEAGAVDAERAADHGDGIAGLLRGDERERLAYARRSPSRRRLLLWPRSRAPAAAWRSRPAAAAAPPARRRSGRRDARPARA